MTKKSDKAPKLKSSGLGWLALAALGGVALHAANKAVSPGEWETVMLPPGRTPEGEGWEPMRAVEHTSIYGGLAGKPQARVVWKRRKPAEPTEDKDRFSLESGGFFKVNRSA